MYEDIIKHLNGTVIECNTAYDGERNENLLNGCNMLKAFTLMDCYLDEHGNFAPASSMFEVKSKVRRYDREIAKAEKAKVKACKAFLAVLV